VLFGRTPQRLGIVAIDGVPIKFNGSPSAPIASIDHVAIPPGGRVEFIVQGPPLGVPALLVTRSVDTGPDGENDPNRALASIVAAADAPDALSRLPSNPAPLPPAARPWVGSVAPVRVRLEIEQEISNVLPTSTASLTPTVSERKVKSSISVQNGQTVLLAGLISEQQNGTRSGIPVLDQIPGLGDAFGHQDNSTARTELIIFIRPQIIRNGSDAHLVAEELRSKLRGSIATTTTNQAVTTSVH
jgi:hypothetical protein